MKRLAALALWCGCGRVAFDARQDGAPSPPIDGAPDARKYFVDGGECPPGYTFDTAGCYRAVLMPTSLGWVDAEAACEQDAFGSHLVVIDNAAEAAVVDRQVPGTILSHWIGFSDRVTEGTFLTVQNQPIGYANWATAQPSGGTAANCVLFFDDTTLSTQDCAVGDDFVCEYDGIPPVPAAW